MAGATIRRPTCVRSSARSAGSARARALTVSLAHANNALTGQRPAGLPTARDRDYDSVYTKPDTTDNRSTLAHRQRRATFHGSAVAVARTPTIAICGRSTLQRRHQRGIARSESSISPAPPSARRWRPPGYGNVPGQRARCEQHAVSLAALHRQRAAERRAGGEVQRPDQPDADRSAERRPSGQLSRSRRARIAHASVHGGRGVRPQHVGVRAVDRARLSESRSQRHRPGRVRRRR